VHLLAARKQREVFGEVKHSGRFLVHTNDQHQASHLHILVKKFQVWLFGFVRGMYSMFDSEKILRSVFFVALFHRDFLTLCTAGLCMIDSPSLVPAE
jgi:hypothetical protein